MEKVMHEKYSKFQSKVFMFTYQAALGSFLLWVREHALFRYAGPSTVLVDNVIPVIDLLISSINYIIM